MLGSCYGTSGPLDEIPKQQRPPWIGSREGTARAAAGTRYAADFPFCTVRDTVALHHALLVHLGVRSVHAVVGGSAGGMQALVDNAKKMAAELHSLKVQLANEAEARRQADSRASELEQANAGMGGVGGNLWSGSSE